MGRIYKLLLLFLIVGSGVQQSWSQELSTQGKTFWMTFMENIGTPDNTPELKIVISCNKATTGTVKNILLNLTQSFSIPAGGGVDTVQIKTFMGYTTGTEASSSRRMGLLIEAADTVAVSAQSTKPYSCDAALIYPIEALGVDYRVFSHMGDQTGNTSGYRSTFAIVATEDNTSIEITPTAATAGGNSQNTKFTITLNKGETYQVKSSTNKNDLSGTLIQALNCKKIAVFGGATRASVIYGNCGMASYDHLYEQLMPINLWGKKFVCIPSIYVKGKQRRAEMIKVVSNTNSTVVRCDGRLKVLNVAGQWDTFFIKTGAVITSNRPIGLCQYALTEGCDGVPGGSDTDPYMMWVPPIEQSLKELNFVCENALTINKFFLNVVVKTSFKNQFLIDGAAPSATWATVSQDTSYSYLQQDGLTVGKHNMTCPLGFSANLYAYGDHGSYGYNAGSAIKPLSFYMTAGGKSSADFELDSPYFYVCQGTTNVSFDVVASYTPTAWKWLFSDGYATKTSKTFKRDFPDTGLVKIRAITFRPSTGICNGVSTDTLIQYVKVYGRPKITLLNDTTICRGNSFYITSKTDGDTNYTFSPGTWLSCTNCMTPYASPLMDTTYAVVATTKGCPPTRDTFKVKIRDSLFLFHSNDTTICRGTSTTLSAWAKGGLLTGQTLTWDNGLGTGLTKTVSPMVTTTYRVILTDGCTKDASLNFYADTAFIKVTVHDSLKITMPNDTTVCEGNTVTLAPVIKGGRPGTTVVTWNNGLGTGDTKSITMGSATMTYKAVLSDGCTNPKDSGFTTINVRPGLKIDTIIYPNPVCRNTLFKVQLKLSGGDSAGYRVKLLNYTVPGPPVVVDSFKNTAFPYFNIMIPDDSKFRISFSQTCNSNNAPLKPFNVNIKNSLGVSVNTTVDTICTGQSYDIQVNGGSADNLPIKFVLRRKTGPNTSLAIDSLSDMASVTFKVSPTATATDYIIIGDDKCNRTDTTGFRLMVRAPLALVSPLTDADICRGRSVSFAANHTGGKVQSISYEWTNPLDNSLLGNTKSITVTPTTTMDISLKVDDGCSAPVNDQVRVTISPLVTDSTLATDLAGCEPYQTSFSYPLTLAQPINPVFDWVWYFNGAISSTTASSGGQTHSPISKTYSTAGIYDGKVELRLKDGITVCNSYSQQINVWKQAIADFSYSPDVIDIIEPNVFFTNKSTGASIYSWNFGDTSAFTSTEENPMHIYGDTGEYLVTLIATNPEGCGDTTTNLAKYRLRVLDIFRIWIPDAFSPNTDEFNTYWFPNATSIMSMEYEIFNRWGQQVFNGNENVKWYGEYKGYPTVICPQEIYYYHIKVRDNRKRWHYYNGTLTLLR